MRHPSQQLAPVSQYELAVVAALRAHAWLWLTACEVQDASAPHIIPVKGTRNVGVKRRVVRHHLERLAVVGAVEVGNPWEQHERAQPYYRWLRSAPADYVEHLQQAARAAGRILPAVADPPTHCALGHAFTTEGEATVHVFPDGQHGCIPLPGGRVPGVRPRTS